jgi:hypothetical protein
MNRPTLTALALGVGIALAPASAWAKVPDPYFSHVDPVLTGDASGSHAYTVVLRGVTNEPIYRVAVLDFSKTNVRLYATQEAGATFDCASKTLARMTDLTGTAVFHPRFGGCANGQDVLVSGDGVIVGQVPARSTDMDGIDGCTGLGDFGMFAERFLSSLPHPEADFDNSGGPLGLGDLSIFSQDLLSDVKGSYCP